MQTLKDEMIRDLLRLTIPITLITDIINYGTGHFEKSVAYFMIMLRICMAHLFFGQVALTALTR